MITGSGAEAKASWHCVFWEGRVLLTASGWTWFMMEMSKIQIKEKKWKQRLKCSSIAELRFISLLPQTASCYIYYFTIFSRLIKSEWIITVKLDACARDGTIQTDHGGAVRCDYGLQEDPILTYRQTRSWWCNDLQSGGECWYLHINY